MSAPALWHGLPIAIRRQLSHLGPCLGTGSVKQVHRVRFRDEDAEYAIGVLRNRVQDEALSSLTALEASDDLQPVAKQLGRLVYGEFDLFGEGEALADFAVTSIGQHPRFRVVKVKHHSPKCLVEEIANGPTVGRALRGVTKTSIDSALVHQTLELLHDFHTTVFSAFVNDGLIHSDIHLGNMVREITAEGAVQFALFDVGQYERIGPADTKAILWALSWISTPDRHKMLRGVALKHLAAVSTIRCQTPMSTNVNEDICKRIELAFEEAVAPNADGDRPDKKTAYMLLLRNCEQKGVMLPKGAFSVAKLIDGILSQADSYGLPTVVDDAVESFLKRTINLDDAIKIGLGRLWG